MWMGGKDGVEGVEIVPVGAAWMATKATCRVFLTDLRDLLAVSLGDVLEKGSFFEGLLTATRSCRIIDHFNLGVYAHQLV